MKGDGLAVYTGDKEVSLRAKIILKSIFIALLAVIFFGPGLAAAAVLIMYAF